MIALFLLCLVVSTVNLQFYLESRVATKLASHTVTCINKSARQKSYFDMSLDELMEVMVVSRTDVRPSSHLLYFKRCCQNWAQKFS